VPIRYITEDTRSDEQVNADDRVRNEVERTGGVWAQMTTEQRAALGITGGTIRLSVGTESATFIRDALAKGLAAVK
jgi:O-acetylhomoserine/O-acetylserine sulfhydrylase-like pyridoxal-dependent enzyme